MGARLSQERGGSDNNGSNIVPSGSAVSGALSSLWSTSTDKDDTCVQWGLVSLHFYCVWISNQNFTLFRARKKGLLGFSLAFAWA